LLARTHIGAQIVAAGLGRLDLAQGHLDEARRLVAEHGAHDRWGYVSLARAEAELAMRRGSPDDMARASGHLRAELEDELRDLDRVDILLRLGEVKGDLGHADGVPVLREAVELLRRLSLDDGTLAGAVCSLAEHELRAGDDAAAAWHQQESMRLAAEVGLPVLIGHALVLAARLAERFDLPETAIRLHGAADVLYEDAGFELIVGDQALSDAMRRRVETQLGPERVGALTREGRALDRQTAIELAEGVFGRARGQ
jgi:hypothetical protein